MASATKPTFGVWLAEASQDQVEQVGVMTEPIESGIQDNLAPSGGGGRSIHDLCHWIICSLYVERVVPRTAMLQWMFTQLTGVKLTVAALRAIVSQTPGVYENNNPPVTEPSHSKKMTVQQKNLSAELVNPPEGFLGFISENDWTRGDMEDDVFDAACSILSTGGWELPRDQAHRGVAVAAFLQTELESTTGFTMCLGECLAFARAAIARPGHAGMDLLGHSRAADQNGVLVPYPDSDEFKRANSARLHLPMDLRPEETYIKTWDELRHMLSVLIKETPSGSFDQCRLKLLIRARFSTELCETVFGYETLSKLLSDERLADFNFPSHEPQRLA